MRPLFLFLLATPLAAQDTAPLQLTRISSSITIDGVLTEAEWAAVPALPLTMYTPVFRGNPTQRSEIRVAYDDENLYAAGWFHDTEPDRIRINSLYRDRWNGDDALAIYVDAFNDNRTAKWFGLTAGGTRFDLLLSDDGNVTNDSWDAFWFAKTTVTDSGWFAEVRIPLSTLGFQTGSDGRTIMGLTVTRLVARNQERVTFPAIDPKGEFRRPSLAQDVVLTDVRSHRPLYVSPYVLGGATRSMVQSAPASPFTALDRGEREAGLDVRYPVTPELNLDLTYNTDFAQVEADDQQVNLDRFPLFFPDRRRFFQERSEVFDFALGGSDRLFHSRRIGLTPTANPSPVPIIGGVRLTGRAADWDVGFLEMQTREHDGTPAENFGVLRLRRGIINPQSTAGMMFTSYSGGARTNFALGGDAVVRLPKDHYFTTRVSSTIDDADPDDVTLTSRSHYYATLQRRTQRGHAYTINYTQSGRDFRPELGFQPRRNYTSANWVANHYFFTDESKTFRRVFPGALAFNTWRNSDRRLESGQYAVWLQWETKRLGGGWIEPKVFRENVLTQFRIGNAVTIPAGDYTYTDYQLVLMMSSGRPLRSSLDFRTGEYFDGRRTQVVLSPTWNASRHFELGGDYQFNALRFPVRQERADIHVARLRVRTALDAQKSGNAFIQYNSTSRRLDFNVRLRYAFAEGTDLWLVYNEWLDTDRDVLQAGRSPLSLARTVLLKYTHTLAF